jgi:hypothetical protein
MMGVPHWVYPGVLAQGVRQGYPPEGVRKEASARVVRKWGSPGESSRSGPSDGDLRVGPPVGGWRGSPVRSAGGVPQVFQGAPRGASHHAVRRGFPRGVP